LHIRRYYIGESNILITTELRTWENIAQWIQKLNKNTFLWQALLVLEALLRKHSVFCKKMYRTKFEQKGKVSCTYTGHIRVSYNNCDPHVSNEHHLLVKKIPSKRIYFLFKPFWFSFEMGIPPDLRIRGKQIT